MDSKRAILLDSVKKLIALGIPDQEIIGNLRQVSVSDADARSLLAEARGEKPAAKKPAPKPAPEPLDEDVTDSEGVLGEVYAGLEKEESEEETGDEGEEGALGEGEETGDDEKEEEKPPKKPVPGSRPPAAGRGPTPLQKTFGFFGKKAIVEASPARPTPFPKPEPVPAPQPVERKADVERLWDSGILTTIDARLDEMKRLRQELEAGHVE